MDAREKNRNKIRRHIEALLKARNDSGIFKDSDLLFISARLSSLDAIEVIMLLESEYGVDFSRSGFDQELIDSVSAIMRLLEK